MGSLLHGNAKTTPRIRKEIQDYLESAPEIAKRLNLNIKTVLKWKKSDSVEDKRSGPAQPKSVYLQQNNRLFVSSDASLSCP